MVELNRLQVELNRLEKPADTDKQTDFTMTNTNLFLCSDTTSKTLYPKISHPTNEQTRVSSSKEKEEPKTLYKELIIPYCCYGYIQLLLVRCFFRSVMYQHLTLSYFFFVSPFGFQTRDDRRRSSWRDMIVRSCCILLCAGCDIQQHGTRYMLFAFAEMLHSNVNQCIVRLRPSFVY